MSLFWGGAASARTKPIQVVIDRVSFLPADVKCRVGDTIEWHNKDGATHTATARAGDWDFEIASTKRKTLILKKAGTIEYYCRLHPGMSGRLLVGPRADD